MTTTALVPSSVEIRPDDTLDARPGAFVVSPIWNGVDRPNVGGILVLTAKDAERLKAAYLSGQAFESTEVRTDVNGQTYVGTHSRISGRYLRADLKKLGF